MYTTYEQGVFHNANSQVERGSGQVDGCYTKRMRKKGGNGLENGELPQSQEAAA